MQETEAVPLEPGVAQLPASGRGKSLFARAGLLGIDRARTVALGRFAVVAAQVALLVLVMRQFHLESHAFYGRIAPLALVGFVIHAALPLRHRLGFFLLLSVTGIGLVFGAASGAWLVGIGLALAGIAHLPISFGKRVALLAAAGAGLAALRADLLVSPVPGAIWPILGSMFMFRLVVYMYDLKHAREKPDWKRTLSYFFLLPNVTFPLFPVVDFATFRRTYYDQDAIAIYQRGVQWMVRGVVHLLLYRLVYQYLVISPEEVTDGASLVRHLIANFLLYLRVSGQFHLIVGMLHLFGFRLPETHHFFYLASSFTDFWRRINIYWKDFMMKVVYYPAFFRLRKLGTTAGLVTATLLVFFGTWLLHAYQWFWLLGTFLLTVPDVLFWAILAVLLVANTLYEAKHGRQRAIEKQSWTPLSLARHSLRVAGTFSVICILWSLWSSESVGEWLALWRAAFDGGHQVAWRPETLALALVASAMVVAPGGGKPGKRGGAKFWRTAGGALATLAVLWAAGSPAVGEAFGGRTAAVIRDVRAPHLSQRDAERMQRGYYENLTGVNRFNSQLWEVYARRPSKDAWPNVLEAGIARRTNDIRHWELRPHVGTEFHGAPFRTNRWGMRDRDYEKTPPANRYRVALLGASYVMGDGVADHETFEWLLEERLAEERQPDAPGIEILNFGTPNFFPPRHLALLHDRVFDFEPDAVFMVAHRSDAMDFAHVLYKSLEEGFELPFDFLRAPIEREGITRETPREEALRRLLPYRDRLLAETYARIVADCRARGVLPVWVYVPTPYNLIPEDELASLRQVAADAGFEILDIADVYDGEELRSLWTVDWDYHPNAHGHRLIADRLYDAIMEHGGILPTAAATRPAADAPAPH